MKNLPTSSLGPQLVQFATGKIVATPGALRLLEQNAILPTQLIARHVRGDFGIVPEEDADSNRSAIENSRARILSSYQVGSGKVWLITEWDRSVTTILLPDEY
jgi:hypothetical protein